MTTRGKRTAGQKDPLLEFMKNKLSIERRCPGLERSYRLEGIVKAGKKTKNDSESNLSVT